MEKLKSRIESLTAKVSTSPVLVADTLKSYGLEDITLRPYQLDGVQWLVERYHRHHGCILADEMGLGKTCQTIAFLVYLQGSGESQGPHLVLSPLSVLSNWTTELKRFAPSLKILNYVGTKEERPELREAMKNENYNVVLTTYELCLKDESFLRQYSWHTLVVDEAHRLKNRQSLLHQVLLQFDFTHYMLLTGTPVQNNLKELYALLSFVASSIFKDRYMEQFVDECDGGRNSKDVSSMADLHDLLKPFLLRRIKSEVVKDLPMKTEVILYHGMSATQKKYYKALLTKDIEAFDNPTNTNKTRIMNVLMQLRKCVNHPYLFDGVEPEPFLLGEHLIEASGKLVLLDQLLSYLQAQGHKVLLFSQMTRVLDIIQDYLGYRGFSYERLDGSVRGEERYLAVKNFNEDDDTFIFLLSTRAGGQGLNLVAADTVIFMDSDFNPQNDLQAAARAHRIGQTRAVKVIRLMGRSTVEEIIFRRAMMKLQLTHDVIEGGQFSTASDKTALIADDNFQLQDILKFGVDKLFENEDSTIEDVNFETILGQTRDGEWQAESAPQQTQLQSPIEVESMADGLDTEMPPGTMYMFEGIDYSKEPSTADKKAFDELIAAEIQAVEESTSDGRALRKHNSFLLGELPETSQRKPRKPLTAEEIEARKQKRAETLTKRAEQAEILKAKREQLRLEKKQQLWVKNGYSSLAIALDSEGEESESDNQSEGKGAEPMMNLQSDDDEGGQKIDLGYLVGDVTRPQKTDEDDAIIVHCVDDSGQWGRGGIFTALTNRSRRPEERYELASEMKDVNLGDLHLILMDDDVRTEKGHLYCGLIIAQHRDKYNTLSGIKMSALDEGLKKLHKAAKTMKATVHIPRIGYNTPAFNWYGTERLIRKHLTSKGIPTYIYYYPRKLKRKATRQRSTESDDDDVAISNNHKVRRRYSTEKSRTPSPQPGTSKIPDVPTTKHQPPVKTKNSTAKSKKSETGFMAGVTVHFHRIPQDVMNKYQHQLVAKDGDVDEFMSKSTSHVIVEEDLAEDQQDDLIAIVEEYRKTPVVTLTWLTGCLAQGKKLQTENYLFG